MTVRELIDLLKKQDPYAKVLLSDDGFRIPAEVIAVPCEPGYIMLQLRD